MKYTYSIIRFTPNPVRGESINLGVIVGCDDTSEWIVQTVHNTARARRLEEETETLPAVLGELERLAHSADITSGIAERPRHNASLKILSEDWLASTASDSQNIIQYSKPMPIIAASAQAAVELVWPLFIFEPTTSKRADVTRTKMHAQIRAALKKRNLGADQIKESATLMAKGTSTKVDFAFHNGVVKEIAQCYSFQIQDKAQVLNEAKAWAWTMRGLRINGGVVASESGKIVISKDVPVTVLYAATPADERAETVQEAMDVFRDEAVGADVESFDNAEKVVDTAAQRLMHA